MYSNIGDIFTIIVCVVLFFVLHMTYVQKNKRLMFIKLDTFPVTFLISICS